MGVWGGGNFDNDNSRDFLADMVGGWERNVDQLLAGQIPEELSTFDLLPGLDTCEMCVIATIEVLTVVAAHLEPDYLPAHEVVERWRTQYLTLFDRECGIWDTTSEHLAQRRTVIDATFRRLLGIVDRHQAS